MSERERKNVKTESKHSLQFIELKFLHISSYGVFAAFEVTEEAVIVGGTDGKENLHPTQRWDGVDGSDTVGDVGKFESGGDFAGEAVHFLYDISDHGQHANTSVFQFGCTVGIKRFLINVAGESQRIL